LSYGAIFSFATAKILTFLRQTKKKRFFIAVLLKNSQNLFNLQKRFFCGTLTKNLAGRASGMQIKQALCIPHRTKDIFG